MPGVQTCVQGLRRRLRGEVLGMRFDKYAGALP